MIAFIRISAIGRLNVFRVARIADESAAFRFHPINARSHGDPDERAAASRRETRCTRRECGRQRPNSDMRHQKLD